MIKLILTDLEDVLACLLDSLPAVLHLLGIITGQKLVLPDAPVDGRRGDFLADRMGILALVPSVEPGLDPPALSGIVGIDGADALDVVALEIALEVGKGVDHLT